MQRLETSSRKTWRFWQNALKQRSDRAFKKRARNATAHRSAGRGSAPKDAREFQQMGSGVGGARRDRTDDLLLAKQALSQLSYGPCGSKAERSQRSEARSDRLFWTLISGFRFLRA